MSFKYITNDCNNNTLTDKNNDTSLHYIQITFISPKHLKTTLELVRICSNVMLIIG